MTPPDARRRSSAADAAGRPGEAVSVLLVVAICCLPFLMILGLTTPLATEPYLGVAGQSMDAFLGVSVGAVAVLTTVWILWARRHWWSELQAVVVLVAVLASVGIAAGAVFLVWAFQGWHAA